MTNKRFGEHLKEKLTSHFKTTSASALSSGAVAADTPDMKMCGVEDK